MSLSVTEHNQSVLEELCPGDLIEIKRGVYSHWAIYKGDGKVIHLAGDDNDGINATVNSSHILTICCRRFRKAFVKVDDFWTVTLGCKAYKNNSMDKDQNPRPAEAIVAEALEMIGELGYNVLWSNCEHFAKLCRYGKPSSQQVDNIFKRTAIALGCMFLSAGLAYFLSTREDNKKRIN